MRILGVIDLKNGQAVHARGGQRETYAAVSAANGTIIDGDPLALARLYVDTFGIGDIYIADLDAIASGAPQYDSIRGVSRLGVSVYVDGGITTPEEARRLVRAGATAIVVGLETMPSFETLKDIAATPHWSTMFSLDLRNGVPMGPTGRATSPEDAARCAAGAGVTDVIVLDVARVGGNAGPDVEMLQRIKHAVPGACLLAGGGVRSLDDLRRLAAIHFDGALIASALHDGRLTPADIAEAKAL